MWGDTHAHGDTHTHTCHSLHCQLGQAQEPPGMQRGEGVQKNSKTMYREGAGVG